MARIAGIDIPREKRVEISLTYIYGIGLPTSQKVLAQAMGQQLRTESLETHFTERIEFCSVGTKSRPQADVEQVVCHAACACSRPAVYRPAWPT